MCAESEDAVEDAVELELRQEMLPPDRLAQIAAEYPQLRSRVMAHPNAYPELVEWIQAAQRGVAPEVYAQAEPEVYAQAEPEVYAQPEPEVYAQPEPEVYGQPEPEVYAQPGVQPEAEMSAQAQYSAPPPEYEHSADHTPAPTETPQLSRGSKMSAALSGVAIGVVLGAATSAVLLLWVLPGVWGSVIG